ncbi:Proteasome activator complex subunit 2 [Nibea albiflora]|uniref:Proteasome activator complex subunit 2 n=1 Tax=Nibea albiflora TaxID=240163 RepID=A0ACB7F6S4_NIBAL|nr:Proteasome activator complex subunit 2 [Nibea albiflora]
MSKTSTLKISRASAGKVESFRQGLYQEVCSSTCLLFCFFIKNMQHNSTFCPFQADNLFSNYIPLKIVRLDAFLKDDALNISDMTSLHAPLDIPIPDPPSPEEEEMETDKNEEDEKKKKKAPKCGYIKGNEKITALLEKVKPEIVALRETINVISCWIQHLIPKIEDGNDFGVAVQMDYRSLVHEKDETVYSEIKVIVMDIRGFYAELYDIISKNLEKVTNPKGEEKPSMY